MAMTMLTGNFNKKVLTVTFAIISAMSFSQAATAQSFQTQMQDPGAQDGVQTDGFGLSVGQSDPTARYCGAGALNVYVVWINNGATQEQAMGAYDEYFNNCQCAKYGGKYCG